MKHTELVPLLENLEAGLDCSSELGKKLLTKFLIINAVCLNQLAMEASKAKLIMRGM